MFSLEKVEIVVKTINPAFNPNSHNYSFVQLYLHPLPSTLLRTGAGRKPGRPTKKLCLRQVPRRFAK